MSRTTIINKINGLVKTAKEYSYAIFHVNPNNEKVSIKSIDHNIKTPKDIDYAITKINFTPIKVKPQTVLPFRVRFTTIGEGREGIPPIGIAIIGYNNYIL